MQALADRELVIVLGHATLRGDVLRDNLVGYIAAAADEVASCPKVAAPELPVEASVLRQQVVRRLALHGLHQPARRYVRRGADEQMHMVTAYRALEDLDVEGATCLPDQLTHPTPDFAFQDRLAVLGREHEMVVQLIHGVRGSTVLAHTEHRTASLLKASPEGEGFHPPRMGQ